MQATRLIHSRAPAGSMTRAGPVSRTGLAPTGENSFDLRGLACIAQTRQDPERGGLWTRSVVAELIDRKFGIRLGLTAVGALLAKLGLTPQKPLQRAYQRD